MIYGDFESEKARWHARELEEKAMRQRCRGRAVHLAEEIPSHVRQGSLAGLLVIELLRSIMDGRGHIPRRKRCHDGEL
jgi:hypothetical protein